MFKKVKEIYDNYYKNEPHGKAFPINKWSHIPEVEDWWMGDRESFVDLTPSRYHIDAWEHCELLYITKEGVNELQEKVPAYREMRLKLDERNIMANNRRLTSAISSLADKRYTDLLECYPELIERFLQHIIASYLGINKDTLSRVKRQHNLK